MNNILLVIGALALALGLAFQRRVKRAEKELEQAKLRHQLALWNLNAARADLWIAEAEKRDVEAAIERHKKASENFERWRIE